MQVLINRAIKTLAIGVVSTMLFTGTAEAENTPTTEGMSYSTWSPYITPDELTTLIASDPDTQILDIRALKYVKKGVIPGALSIPFKEWRGPKESPGQQKTVEELEEFLGTQGLDLDEPIVIHNHSGKTIQTGRAAIVYWILKSSGANEIAILNGGFKAWSARNYPQTTTVEDPQATIVDLEYRYDWWASPVDVFGVASGQVEGSILDARLDGQVKKSIKTGKPLQSLPMARFIPASFFMNPLAQNNMTSEAKTQFRTDLEARGVDLNKGFLISVCQTGELSAISWFYASEIVGLDNVRYYPEALKGWKADGGILFGLKPS